MRDFDDGWTYTNEGSLDDDGWTAAVQHISVGKMVTSVANLMSVVACLVLLCKFCRMRSRVWHRLFPRQLWNLALGDSLYSTALILNNFSFAIIPQFGTSNVVQDNLCRGVVGALLSGMYISAFVEAHVAVGFACIYWRQLRVLSCLSKSLLLVWPVGIALGAAQSAMIVEFGGAVDHFQSCTMKTGPWKQAEALILLALFLVSMLAYTAAAFRVNRHDPSSVQRAVWKTTWIYPVNFFITYGPLVLYLFLSANRPMNSPALFYLSVTMEGLNGLINASCYALTNHYARLRFQRSASGVHVRNRDAEAPSPGEGPDDGCLLDTLDESSVLDNLVSFHVGFRSDASILSVPCTQQAALKRSERDMARISSMLPIDNISDEVEDNRGNSI